MKYINIIALSLLFASCIENRESSVTVIVKGDARAKTEASANADALAEIQGTKFAPQERVSSLTAAERRDAIARKKREVMGVDVETLLGSNEISFSIVQPNLYGKDITQDISDRVAVKLLQIASQNGICALGTNPFFVFGTDITQTGRAATGTAPQKMTVSYELTFMVMNTVTGDVYATATQQVMGVGNSFEEANQNFVNEIKNTAEVQAMLQTAGDRIVEWYEANVQSIKDQVKSASIKGEYELALAIAMSVPRQATTAYEYASSKIEDLTRGLMHKRATDILDEMTARIASAHDDFDPGIGAYFSLIPGDMPEYEKAKRIYNQYIAKCDARRKALEEKAERDENAERELMKLNMKYEHEAELCELEVRKVTAKYTCEEAARKAEANARVAQARIKAENKRNTLFGSIGYAISGTFERAFRAVDSLW